MTIESTAKKGVAETVEKTASIVESSLKKAWSILDAATEKKPPSEYLSPQAVRAIQGNIQ